MTGQGLKLLYLGAGLLLVTMGLGNAFIQQQSLRVYYEQYEMRYYNDRSRDILIPKEAWEIELEGKNNKGKDMNQPTQEMDETELSGLLMGTAISGWDIDIEVEGRKEQIHSVRELEDWMQRLHRSTGGMKSNRNYTLMVGWVMEAYQLPQDMSLHGRNISKPDRLRVSIMRWRDEDGK